MGGIARQIQRRMAKAERLDEKWKRQIAQPLLDRLGPKWIREEAALKGLNYPSMRAFWAVELGLVERRRIPLIGGLFGDPIWIRLTKKGWASE
jgi:hypothetical protein